MFNFLTTYVFPLASAKQKTHRAVVGDLKPRNFGAVRLGANPSAHRGMTQQQATLDARPLSNRDDDE